MEQKRVWVPDEKEGWLLGVVKRAEGKFLHVETPSGVLVIRSTHSLARLCLVLVITLLKSWKNLKT